MIRFVPTCLLALGALAYAVPSAPAAGSESKQEAMPLQVQVMVPPTWQAWIDDDVAEAFTDRVREVFRHRGFAGKVREITAPDEPSTDAPLLTINLIEWRVSHIGNIECTFTANLQTAKTTHQFGIYTNTEMRWLQGPGRFGLARSFENAAEGAIRQLADDIGKTELLPGLRNR